MPLDSQKVPFLRMSFHHEKQLMQPSPKFKSSAPWKMIFGKTWVLPLGMLAINYLQGFFRRFFEYTNLSNGSVYIIQTKPGSWLLASLLKPGISKSHQYHGNRVTDAGRKSTEGHRSIDDFEHWKLQPSDCYLSETTKQPFSNDGEVVRFQGMIKTNEKTGTSFNMFNPAKRGQSKSPAKMSRNLCCCFVLQRILGQIKLFPYQGCCPLQGLFCASKLHVGWEGSQEEACHQGHSHFIPCLPRHVRLQTVPTSSMWQFVSATSTQTQPPGPQSCASPVVGWPGWKDAHLCSWSWEFVSSRLETPSGTGWVEAPFEAEIKSKLYKSELHSLHTQKRTKKPWQHLKNHVFLETKRGFFAQFRLNRLDPRWCPLFFQGSKGSHMADRMAATNAASDTDWLVVFFVGLMLEIFLGGGRWKQILNRGLCSSFNIHTLNLIVDAESIHLPKNWYLSHEQVVLKLFFQKRSADQPGHKFQVVLFPSRV